MADLESSRQQIFKQLPSLIVVEKDPKQGYGIGGSEFIRGLNVYRPVFDEAGVQHGYGRKHPTSIELTRFVFQQLGIIANVSDLEALLLSESDDLADQVRHPG